MEKNWSFGPEGYVPYNDTTVPGYDVVPKLQSNESQETVDYEIPIPKSPKSIYVDVVD